MKKLTFSNLGLALLLAVAFVYGCKKDEPYIPEWPVERDDKNYSVTPAFVKTLPGFEHIGIATMISSDDTLEQSPEFVYGGSPDGGGIIPNPDGEGFLMITNHEKLQAVSRVYLDKGLKPLKGEYIVDGAGGMWRLCSATLATPQEHGFGPVFLTVGEGGPEAMVHAIDPLGSVNDKSRNDRTLPALGKCSAENAVPLPKTAYNGKTVIFIGEDESKPVNSMGQLNMYVSNSVGDLQNGKLYMLRRKDRNVVETDMQVGESYEVEFVAYSNVKSSTGTQLVAQTIANKAIMFARVEDLDYGKGTPAANRTLYFSSTGVSPDKVHPAPGFTMWGRVYKLELVAKDPLKGKITPLMDGNVDPGNSIVNPDNICVTENYVYIQEDGDSFYQESKHDGRIWQYSLQTKELKPMLEMNHRRDNPIFNAKFNSAGESRLGSWEYGAMYDVSELTGKPGTFVLNIHPHTWKQNKFLNADGSGVSPKKEGGQTVILTNVPR